MIGLQVSIKLLKAVHPSSQNEKFLRKSLKLLVESGIMVEEPDPDQNLFSFKHGYFQEAAYSLLSVEGKKELHLLIANEYEVSAFVPLRCDACGLLATRQPWHFRACFD